MTNGRAGITIRALSERVIAIDCHSTYSDSKPSLLVPERKAIAEGTPGVELETGALRVESDAAGTAFRVFRKSEADPIAVVESPSPDSASIRIDRGYPIHGVGGNNAWCFRTQDDIDHLTDIDLDRKGHSYRIH